MEKEGLTERNKRPRRTEKSERKTKGQGRKQDGRTGKGPECKVQAGGLH